MDGIYKNIEEYNPNKKCEILIVFDDMITEMLSNKKVNPIVTEVVTRGRKLNIYLVLLPYLILMCQKLLDEILCTILLWKFTRTSTNFIE